MLSRRLPAAPVKRYQVALSKLPCRLMGERAAAEAEDDEAAPLSHTAVELAAALLGPMAASAVADSLVSRLQPSLSSVTCLTDRGHSAWQSGSMAIPKPTSSLASQAPFGTYRTSRMAPSPIPWSVIDELPTVGPPRGETL